MSTESNVKFITVPFKIESNAFPSLNFGQVANPPSVSLSSTCPWKVWMKWVLWYFASCNVVRQMEGSWQQSKTVWSYCTGSGLDMPLRGIYIYRYIYISIYIYIDIYIYDIDLVA